MLADSFGDVQRRIIWMTITRCLCRYHVDDNGMHCLSVNCPVRGRMFPFKGSILSITVPHFYLSSRPGQEIMAAMPAKYMEKL